MRQDTGRSVTAAEIVCKLDHGAHSFASLMHSIRAASGLMSLATDLDPNLIPNDTPPSLIRSSPDCEHSVTCL
jgi:hypothetical protein